MDFDDGSKTKLVAIGMAVFGGIARQCHEWLVNKKPLRWTEFAARGVVSAFMGLLSFDAAQHYVGQQWTASLCGLGGWLGSETVKLIFDYVRARWKPPSK